MAPNKIILILRKTLNVTREPPGGLKYDSYTFVLISQIVKMVQFFNCWLDH